MNFQYFLNMFLKTLGEAEFSRILKNFWNSLTIFLYIGIKRLERLPSLFERSLRAHIAQKMETGEKTTKFARPPCILHSYTLIHP